MPSTRFSGAAIANKTKTIVSTKAKVVALTVGFLALGLAAYGFGFIPDLNKEPVLSAEQCQSRCGQTLQECTNSPKADISACKAAYEACASTCPAVVAESAPPQTEQPLQDQTPPPPIPAEQCQNDCAQALQTCSASPKMDISVCKETYKTCMTQCSAATEDVPPPAQPEPPAADNPTPKDIPLPDEKSGATEDAGPTADEINTPNTTPPTEGVFNCHGASTPRVDRSATYLILTRPMFVEALAPFIAAKNAQGERVAALLVDDMACLGEGRDVPEKIRYYLRQIHETTSVRSVLIVGAPVRSASHEPAELSRLGLSLSEPWEIPMRYVKGLEAVEPIPTDQYYASLNESWNTSLNDLGETAWNEVHDWQKTFDFDAAFAVGRVPVRTAEDLTNWVDKTIHWHVPTAFKESKFVTALCAMRQPYALDEWESASTHVILSHACQTDSGGDIVTYANRELPDLVSSYSHGTTAGITREPSPIGYTMTSASPGFTKPPIMFVHGCEVGGVDYPETSLGETYIARRDGVVAFIGSTRSHADIPFLFQEAVFNHGFTSLGEAFYQAKKHMIADRHQTGTGVDNMFMFALYGDPSLPVVSPSVRVQLDSPVVHVPALTNNEPISVPVHLRSFTDRDLTGGLYHENTVSAVVTLPAHGSVDATLQSHSPEAFPLVPRIDNDLPTQAKTVQFSSPSGGGCDTSRMTCIADRMIVAPPVYLSCARLGKTFGFVDGLRVMTGKTAQVKLLDTSLGSAPLTFTLTLYPGTYLAFMPGTDQLARRTGSEVARMRIDRPTTGSVYQFAFSRTPASTPYSGERAGSYYANPLFKAEAFDEAGRRQGWCWYYGFEPDIENVGF